jgi:hypothetical protein
MLGKIIVDRAGGYALVHEEFGDGAPLKTITTELMSFVLAKLLIISATVEVFCP